MQMNQRKYFLTNNTLTLKSAGLVTMMITNKALHHLDKIYLLVMKLRSQILDLKMKEVHYVFMLNLVTSDTSSI